MVDCLTKLFNWSNSAANAKWVNLFRVKFGDRKLAILGIEHNLKSELFWMRHEIA